MCIYIYIIETDTDIDTDTDIVLNTYKHIYIYIYIQGDIDVCPGLPEAFPPRSPSAAHSPARPRLLLLSLLLILRFTNYY